MNRAEKKRAEKAARRAGITVRYEETPVEFMCTATVPHPHTNEELFAVLKLPRVCEVVDPGTWNLQIATFLNHITAQHLRMKGVS